MNEKPKAKCIGAEISDKAWWFNRYTFECVRCGEHYESGRNDSRTSPYCAKCSREIEAEKRAEYTMLKIRKGTVKMRKDNFIIYDYDYFLKNIDREHEFYKRVRVWQDEDK